MRDDVTDPASLFRHRRGFIATQYLRGPVDYRAIFNETEGRWQLTAFIAGD